ncbi:MAG: cytidine deaminase [Flavobacteriales bacterium]|nr:cytidine deaminase [Flavobacteriales bacterium]
MKKIEFSAEYIEYDDKMDLSSSDKELMSLAIEARNRSYSPYSKFSVGAAVLLDNGKIVTGNNQENAAYPSGMCAERVAIWTASAMYPNVKVVKLALSGMSRLKLVNTPVSPCGACRQVLSEYESKQESEIEIFFTGEEGKVIKTNSVKDLLPFSFDGSLI